MNKQKRLRSLRNIGIELLVYGALVTFYALGVLQFLADPLADLYETNLALYAWVALALIVIQGVVLEGLTSFLLNRLQLARFD